MLRKTPWKTQIELQGGRNKIALVADLKFALSQFFL
jgi:hypothetical protein